MQVWPTMPSETEIRSASLATTLYPCVGFMPAVIASRAYRVVVNVADLFRGPDAAAVYLVPARSTKPARLVLVAGERVKNTREVRWYEGVVGEIDVADPLDLTSYRDPGGRDGSD
jgi:hypothetical protein